MKLLKTIPSLIALAILGNAFFSQPVKADLFCWPWESNCTVDGKIGNDPLGTDFNVNPTFEVYIKNNHDRPIWIAIHYRYTEKEVCTDCSELAVMPPPGSDWHTESYWRLEPGQKVLTSVSTNNRYIYFHAHDDDGHVWGSSNTTFQVSDSHQPFFKVDMGNEIGDYIQGFN